MIPLAIDWHRNGKVRYQPVVMEDETGDIFSLQLVPAMTPNSEIATWRSTEWHEKPKLYRSRIVAYWKAVKHAREWD
jgi:hypothetical protein